MNVQLMPFSRLIFVSQGGDMVTRRVMEDRAALHEEFARADAANDAQGLRALLPRIEDDDPEAAQMLSSVGLVMGYTAESAEQVREAIAVLERATDLRSDSVLFAKVHGNLGIMRLWMLDFQRALADIQSVLAIPLEPEHARYHGLAQYYAGLLLAYREDDRQAEEHFLRALECPLSLGVLQLTHAGLATIAARRGDGFAVRQHLSEVHDPSYAFSEYMAKAELLLAMGDPVTALPLARQGLLDCLSDPQPVRTWHTAIQARKLHHRILAALSNPQVSVNDSAKSLSELERHPGVPQNTLGPMLDSLARMLERQSDGGRCVVFLLDASGRNLRLGAAPSMSGAYRQHVDGNPLSTSPGPCAIALKRQGVVTIQDMALEPEWKSISQLSATFGIGSGIALPIVGQEAKTLGACAIFYPEPRELTESDQTLAQTLADMAAVAIESQQTNETIREQARLYRLVTENASDLILVLRPDATLSYVSPSSEWFVGRMPAELEGQNALDIVWPEDLPQVRACYEAVMQGEPASVVCRVRRREGETLWLEILVRPICDPQGNVLQIVASARNVTERKRIEEQLAHQAYHDQLTGLPNRVAFLERLRQSLARCARNKSSVAVLFLDLDNFKVVNDTLGHERGDELLCAVTARLQTCLRTEDTAARLGGDEFTLLLENAMDTTTAARVAERVATALQEPFVLGGHEVFTTFSIGIALSSSAHQDPADLLRDADVAMYWAKNAGRARYAIFHPSMNARGLERLELENDLRRAVDRGELRLHYQPIVSMATGRPVGFEALVRWQHPGRGLLAPGEFIPVAEETGLILPIGQWTLAEACRQMQAWQRLMPDAVPMTMSVNLSRRQFQQPGLVAEIAQVLERTGLDPTRLQLEITESAMMEDTESAIRALREMKALGIHLAMDDFGTGYSSLSYLKRFPIDVLKIDRSFVRGLGKDTEDTAIVRAMITLARTLNLKVVAEGVETAEHVAQLRELGCELGQGFYFAKPQPVEPNPSRLPEILTKPLV